MTLAWQIFSSVVSRGIRRLMNWLILIFPIHLVFLLFSPAQFLYSQNYQAHINQIDKSEFPDVSVYMSVTDGYGHPEKDLKEENFKVYEDNRTIEITDFFDPKTEQSVYVMLVIDQSGSMHHGGKLNAACQAAETFVRLMKTNDKTGIIAFESSVHIKQPLTSNSYELTRSIRSLRPMGGTAFYDASYEALIRMQSIKGQKAVIALTDGMDTSSRTKLSDIFSHAEEFSIPIFTIGLGRKVTGLLSCLPGDIDEQTLQKIAGKTGGRYYYAPSPGKLTELYQLISSQLQYGYMIKYRSLRPIKDGTRRLVAVDVKFDSFSEKAKRNYYVPGVIVPPPPSPLLFFGLLIPLLLLLFLPSLLKKISKYHKQSTARKSIKKKQDDKQPVKQVTPLVQPIQPITPEPAKLAGEKLKLVAQGHRFSTSTFVLNKPITKVGRRPENDLIINHVSVSNFHAEIRVEKDTYVVQDLRSQNGTFVSFKGDKNLERKITRNAIKNGSTVRFGDVSYLAQLS